MNIKPIKIIKINKHKFNMFMLFTRRPILNAFAKEIEYYSNEDNSLIGVILFDLADKDYNYVLMARDENKHFRAFDIKTDYKTKQEAIDRLCDSIKWKTGQGLKVVEQFSPKKGIDLFKIIVPQDKIHPYFSRLDNDTQFIPSKKAIIEIANHFDDIDGNFIEQFQSLNGFDSRLWEIYLFATLTEQKFIIQRNFDRPDFIIEKNKTKIGVEAVTVGRDKENPPTYLFDEDKILQHDLIDKKLQNETPLRYGSTLFSKLSKKYWELPQLIDNPFLIAIADFHDNASMTWSFISLIEYLYGQRNLIIVTDNKLPTIKSEKIEDYTKLSGAKIKSGFFFEKDSENISGILFSTTGTISKFTRMGIQAGFAVKGQQVLRVGDRYNFDSKSFEPISFSYAVDENCNESWSEGLNLFHNPFAKHPVSMDLFPDIAHHKFENEQIISWVPDFHPFSSININTIIK